MSDQPKCKTCKHEDKDTYEKPYCGCGGWRLWEPKPANHHGYPHHPAALARDEFFEHNKGIQEFFTLGLIEPEKYLRNRLEHAFLAGWAACERSKP